MKRMLFESPVDLCQSAVEQLYSRGLYVGDYLFGSAGADQRAGDNRLAQHPCQSHFRQGQSMLGGNGRQLLNTAQYRIGKKIPDADRAASIAEASDIAISIASLVAFRIFTSSIRSLPIRPTP